MQSTAATETNRRPIQSRVLFSLPQIQPMSMAGLFHFVLFRGFVYLFTVLFSIYRVSTNNMSGSIIEIRQLSKYMNMYQIVFSIYCQNIDSNSFIGLTNELFKT